MKNKFIFLVLVFMLITSLSSSVFAATKVTQLTLNQWEWNIYVGIRDHRWNFAASNSTSKGLYYDSIGNFEKAMHYHEVAAENWTKYGRKDYAAQSTIRYNSSKSKYDQSKKVIIDTLNQWEWDMYVGMRDGKPLIAADSAVKKAAYFKKSGNINDASRYYSIASSYYTIAGQTKLAQLYQTLAKKYGTELSLYVDSTPPIKSSYAPYEPKTGAYLGMFPNDSRVGFDPAKVEDVYGKKHAVFLTYASWDKKYLSTDHYFPVKLAQQAKSLGEAIQIGFEPNGGLEQVVDGPYIHKFAKEMKDSGIPVFVRFASEMNGDWVDWYGNPNLYIEKWRLVYTILKKEAPNAVMVWSPNSTPTANINSYYPGDAYVDWVGLSLYTSPYTWDDKLSLTDNQIDDFRSFYVKYSKKPIMISEGGIATHFKTKPGNFDSWGAQQMANMYAFLPKMFPAVKSITYFNLARSLSINAIWDLVESPLSDAAYQNYIQDPYFITSIATGASTKANKIYTPNTSTKPLRGIHSIFTYIKLPEGIQPYAVAYFQEGKLIATSYGAPWEVTVNFDKIDHNKPILVKSFTKNWTILSERNF